MSRMKVRSALLYALLAVALTAPALAHSEIRSSDPEDNQVLDTAPQRITLAFGAPVQVASACSRSCPSKASTLRTPSAVLVSCKPGHGGGDATATGDPHVTISATASEHPAVGPLTVVVTVTKDGAPLEGAKVTVTGDMTHAGMVPVVDDATADGAGAYRTNDFTFTMAVEWVLTVDVTEPDGAKAQKIAFVSVGRQGKGP